jgi:hypothetical protein
MSIRRALSALGLVAACATVTLSSRAVDAAEVRLGATPKGIDRDDLTARVTRELAPIPREGVVSITFDEAAQTLRVQFAPEIGGPIERTIPTPADKEERLRAAVWLASNLVRDEAADLLGGLRPRETQPPPSAPPIGPPAPAPAPLPPRPCEGTAPYEPVSVALLAPVGWPTTPSNTGFALGALYADLRSLRGLGIAPAVRVRCDARGAVVGGLLALHDGEVRGATVASLTWVSGAVSGAQIGLGNVAREDMRGVEAGLFGYARRVEGAQVALVNVSGSVRGAQVGLINVTTGDVDGAQVGLLNINRDADAAVGIASVSWARHIRIVAWTSTLTPIQVGFVLEGKRVFSTVNLGRLIDLTRLGDVVIGFEIGAHLVRNDDSGMLWDLVLGVDSNVAVGTTALDITRLGTRVGYRVAPRFAPYLYAGGALIGATQVNGQRTTDDVRLIGEVGGGALF